MHLKAECPAFPTPSTYTGTGMDLRDYFAAQALTGILAQVDSDQGDSGAVYVRHRYNPAEDEKLVARLAYKLADAMLAARGQ